MKSLVVAVLLLSTLGCVCVSTDPGTRSADVLVPAGAEFITYLRKPGEESFRAAFAADDGGEGYVAVLQEAMRSRGWKQVPYGWPPGTMPFQKRLNDRGEEVLRRGIEWTRDRDEVLRYTIESLHGTDTKFHVLYVPTEYSRG